MNISGVLVKAYPENLMTIGETLASMPGVEVHGNNDDGRIVITVEDESANDITDTLVQIQDVSGVLSASMIYHQFEE